MRSASSRKLAPGPPALWAGLALAAALAAFGSVPPASRPGSIGVTVVPSAFRAPAQTTALTSAGRRRVRTASWWGHVYTTSTGESVNVSISNSYPVDDGFGQGWSDHFAGLVHGSELQLLHAYVATPVEVQEICGSPYALGCYGSNILVVIGEPFDGIEPNEVAAHEYGHHVAFNRTNPPWVAVDWGPKRWASYAGVCQRASAGTAYPGDEGQHYTQNPGEAFAEVYRVLNDSRAGLPFFWTIVDLSFVPDAAALGAAQQDVLEPYAAPASKTVRGRFTARGRKVWKLALSTQLDGQLDAKLAMPRGALYDLALLAGNGSTVLAHGLWTGTSAKKLSYTVCGQRSLVLRVTRLGSGGRFSITIAQP
jgi:hypothetical protein